LLVERERGAQVRVIALLRGSLEQSAERQRGVSRDAVIKPGAASEVLRA
jgi:hypothetical protein